jgi:ERCC4-type nuclease
MQIITDTREIRNQHILAEFSKHGIPFKVKKLFAGDYTIAGYENKILIERKSSLTELSGNFCKGRKRFESEFIRAMEAGAKIYLLIEDEQGREKLLLRRELDKDKSLTAEERQKKTWRSNFCANSFINSLASWKEKYNLEIKFVKKQESGKEILNIFTKYLEEVGAND